MMSYNKCNSQKRIAISLLTLALVGLLLASCGHNNSRATFKKEDQLCGVSPEVIEALNRREYKVVQFGPNGLMAVESRKTKIDESGKPYYPVGCLDQDKKEIVPLKYSRVFFGPEVICVQTRGNKYGMFDLNGKELAPCEYDLVDWFHGNYTIVKKDSKYGVMNNKGELVIPVQYDQIQQFYDQWYHSWGMDKYRFEDVYYLTKNGDKKVVNLSRTWGSAVGEHIETPFDYQVFERNGKCGIVNYLGEEIAPQYQNIRDHHGNIVDFSEGLVAVVKNNKIGFIDNKGVVRIPFQFDYTEFSFNFYNNLGLFSEGLAPVMKGNKWGYIDTKGNTAIPFVYDGAFCYHKGVALVCNEAGQCGLIDKNNTVVLPFEFENGVFSGNVYNPWNDNLYVMCQNGEWGVYNPSGECLTPCQYEQVDFFGGYATVVKNGKKGLINEQGQLLIPCEYETCMYDVWSGFVYVVKNGKWGVVDTQNQVLVPIEYDQVGPNQDEHFFVVQKEGKTGYYDFCGNLICSPK